MPDKPKQRRGPYSKLPDEVAQHGYVADLVAAIKQAAESMGATMTVHSKNGDYYLSVLVPSKAELDAIDDATDEGNDTITEAAKRGAELAIDAFGSDPTEAEPALPDAAFAWDLVKDGECLPPTMPRYFAKVYDEQIQEFLNSRAAA